MSREEYLSNFTPLIRWDTYHATGEPNVLKTKFLPLLIDSLMFSLRLSGRSKSRERNGHKTMVPKVNVILSEKKKNKQEEVVMTKSL